MRRKTRNRLSGRWTDEIIVLRLRVLVSPWARNIERTKSRYSLLIPMPIPSTHESLHLHCRTHHYHNFLLLASQDVVLYSLDPTCRRGQRSRRT